MISLKRTKQQLLPDGRKYRLVILSMVIMLTAFGMAALSPVLGAALPELITGVLGLNFLYMGGNVGNKWVVGRQNGLTVGTTSPTITHSSPPPAVPRGDR